LSVEAKIHAEYLHTALRVRDLEGAVRFYTTVVGLNEQRRGANGVWLDGVQLVQAPAEQDPANKGVLDHIGFALHNLDEVVESLTTNGVELEARVRETTLPNGQPMRLVFFKDPEGNRIELTERR
jgi:catechol 2,3-dioxygenase-like lactoylglutathione lyase family enzyme